jgi:hypothetical protein
VWHVGVAPPLRRLGLGRALLLKLAADLRRQVNLRVYARVRVRGDRGHCTTAGLRFQRQSRARPHLPFRVSRLPLPNTHNT